MNKLQTPQLLLKQIRILISVFILLLLLSGITAFPLETELNFLTGLIENRFDGILYDWIMSVNEGIQQLNIHFPFMSYGTDWLAFAHIIIALFFVGVYNDPVRNIWTIKTGMIACVLVFPLAFIAGPIRGIPLEWILIDCSFGVFGLIPLGFVYAKIRKLQELSDEATIQPLEMEPNDSTNSKLSAI